MPALTTTLTTAELTALHHETIDGFDLEQSRLERTLANISRRALTLFEDGYSAIQHDDHFYTVLTPAEGRYTVHINDDAPKNDVFGNFCTCPAFEKYKTCKHLQAVLNERVQEANLIAAYEAQQDAYDPYEYRY